MTSELFQLIDRYLDGEATPADFASLEAALDADAALIDTLAARAALTADLRRVAMRGVSNAELGTRTAERSGPLCPRERAGVRAGDPMRPSSALNSRFAIPNLKFAAAAAALLLLAAAAVAIYLFAFNSQPESRDPRPNSPVATVIETTGTLVIGDRIADAGDDIAAGDIALDTGSAEFRLRNGVAVTLRGDSHLTVHDPMSATLARGAAEFDCPHDAKGYTVHLPDGSRIVDLGTRFEVLVGSNRDSRVNVLSGAVEVHAGVGDRATVIVAGQSARLEVVDGVRFLDIEPFDLIRNGSFEAARLPTPPAMPGVWKLARSDAPPAAAAATNTLEGWTVTGSDRWIVGTAFWKASDGAHCLSLYNFPHQAMIVEQAVEVTAGQRYELRFDVGGRFDSPSTKAVQSIRVQVIDGERLLADQIVEIDRPDRFDPHTNPGWQTKSLVFAAESGRIVLRFRSAEQSNAWGVLLDRVRLFAAPDLQNAPAVPLDAPPSTGHQNPADPGVRSKHSLPISNEGERP